MTSKNKKLENYLSVVMPCMNASYTMPLEILVENVGITTSNMPCSYAHTISHGPTEKVKLAL